MGAVIGLFAGLGMIVSAFNGELSATLMAGVVVLTLIGFIFPMFFGTFLMSIMVTSPIAALAGFIFGNASSGWAALGIGLVAFIGQYVIGLVRRDRSELLLPGENRRAAKRFEKEFLAVRSERLQRELDLERDQEWWRKRFENPPSA